MNKQHARGVRLKLTSDPIPTAIEQREKLVLKITRRIAALEAKRRALRRQLKDVATELKAQRRGLRVALQHGETIAPGDQ